MTVPLERRLHTAFDQRVQRDGSLGFIDIQFVSEFGSSSQCRFLLGFRLTCGVIREREVNMTKGDGPLYRLTVDDYSFVLAGRNGRYQRLGVSTVS